MKEEILKKYSLLEKLNVSRETYLDFECFISMLLAKIKKLI